MLPRRRPPKAKLTEHAAWRDKKATHVLIENGKKKALDMMEEAHTVVDYKERMNLEHSFKEKVRQE